MFGRQLSKKCSHIRVTLRFIQTRKTAFDRPSYPNSRRTRRALTLNPVFRSTAQLLKDRKSSSLIGHLFPRSVSYLRAGTQPEKASLRQELLWSSILCNLHAQQLSIFLSKRRTGRRLTQWVGAWPRMAGVARAIRLRTPPNFVKSPKIRHLRPILSRSFRSMRRAIVLAYSALRVARSCTQCPDHFCMRRTS